MSAIEGGAVGEGAPAGPLGAAQRRVAKYVCGLCQRTFTKRSSLNVHREAIHEGVVYQCSECPMTFTQCSSLQRHVRAAHMGFRYKCELCPETFSTNGDLTAHCCRSHQGNRFACGECSGAFADREERNRHRKVDHGKDVSGRGAADGPRERRFRAQIAAAAAAAEARGAGGLDACEVPPLPPRTPPRGVLCVRNAEAPASAAAECAKGGSLIAAISSPVAAMGAAAALVTLRTETRGVPVAVAGASAPRAHGPAQSRTCMVCLDAQGGPSALVLRCQACGFHAHLACIARDDVPSPARWRCTCGGGV